MALALNNPWRLICHKTKKSNQICFFFLPLFVSSSLSFYVCFSHLLFIFMFDFLSFFLICLIVFSLSLSLWFSVFFTLYLSNFIPPFHSSPLSDPSSKYFDSFLFVNYMCTCIFFLYFFLMQTLWHYREWFWQELAWWSCFQCNDSQHSARSCQPWRNQISASKGESWICFWHCKRPTWNSSTYWCWR